MAVRRQTLTRISIYVVLFSILSDMITSARTPASSPTPSESPSSQTQTPTPTPSPTPTPTPTSPKSPSHTFGPVAGTPISLSELFELALPEIGLQKAVVSSQTEGSKVACKQLEAIQQRIEEFKGTLTKRLVDPATQEPSKKCLAQCQDNLDGAILGVMEGIDSIHKNDLSKANSDITGISTDVITCNECFIDFGGEDNEIKTFNDWVQGVTKDSLNNIKDA